MYIYREREILLSICLCIYTSVCIYIYIVSGKAVGSEGGACGVYKGLQAYGRRQGYLSVREECKSKDVCRSECGDYIVCLNMFVPTLGVYQRLHNAYMLRSYTYIMSEILLRQAHEPYRSFPRPRCVWYATLQEELSMNCHMHLYCDGWNHDSEKTLEIHIADHVSPRAPWEDNGFHRRGPSNHSNKVDRNCIAAYYIICVLHCSILYCIA